MSQKEMQAMLEALQAENKALKVAAIKASASKLAIRVSEKGAVSVYGLGKWPVTLYKEQWERLLAHGEAIAGFMAANAGRLAVKGEGVRVDMGSGEVVGKVA